MALRTLPLTATTLNAIRANIKRLAEGYQSSEFKVDEIGQVPGGRALVESFSWPKQSALELFERDGAIRRNETDFEILKPDYFDIEFKNLELPVHFSIDKRIEAESKIMAALYIDINDIENRLRFELEERTKDKFGSDYFDHFPLDVQSHVVAEKARPRWHMPETRASELDYSDFSDLEKVLRMPGLYSDNKVRKALIEILQYLAEVRTRVAHNNPISTDDVVKTHDYAERVRRLIPQLKRV